MQAAAEIGNEIDEDPKWCVLYTRHQHEKVVADTLSAKGFEVFLPLYESVRRWKDRQKQLSLPLFPCYVFVRSEYGRQLHVVSTPGVHMILSYGERVAVIPDSEITAVRKSLEGSLPVQPHPYLKYGERVRVTRGSLFGVEGVLVRKKNLCRLVLSVEMLARSVSVEIDISDVEPVAPPQFPVYAAQPFSGAERIRETSFCSVIEWPRN